MTLAPAHKPNVEDWPPERLVYVPFGQLDGMEEIPADVAYSNSRSARSHFWFKAKYFNARVVELSVREFLHWMAIENDANPFAEINKRQFLAEWKERYL